MPLKKKPCTINGVHYESESAATRALGINLMTIRTRLRSSNFPEYISKHYTKVKRRKKIVPILCTIKGVEYDSLSDASRKTGKSPYMIFKRLRSFDFPDYVCVNIPKVSEPPKPIKYRYKVNGKKYCTLREIGDMDGVTKERIRQKMNSPKYPGYQRL